GSFEAEVSFVRNFMMDHITSLDSIFNNFGEMTKTFEIDENKWYTLTNFLNDKALDLKDSLSDDLTPTALWSVKDGPLESQLFRFTAAGYGSYTVTNKYSGKVLEAYRKTEDGGIPSGYPSYYMLCINPYQYHNASQEWKLEERQYGVFSLIDVYSSMAIDNYGTSTVNGNTISMWIADANNGNQQWKFNERGYVHPITTSEKLAAAKITLYVTPGEVHINSEENYKLSITDMTGHILIQRKVSETAYKVTLPSGLYIITINDTVRKLAVP
ncbi:MAG TPA: RICIN domain-containing protein, partial [Bacteroidales bacterium]